MSKIESYEDLIVWQKAHRFVLRIYQITQKFPVKEQFGLTLQLRRAATSIPANISEGSKRQYTKELIQFLYIAKGSLGESEYYIRLAKDLQYISSEEYSSLYNNSDEIGRLIAGLIQSLKRGQRAGCV